ncbi:glutamine-hydrolyzing GMP synthase [Pillotina sp. SPG140]
MVDTIIILDFGSQTTQLIARRIRDLGVYTEIVAGDSTIKNLDGVRGIILSGSPESVYAAGLAPDPFIYQCGLPLLGICYGLQRINVDQGGVVEALREREYGPTVINVDIRPDIRPEVNAFLSAHDTAIPLESVIQCSAESTNTLCSLTVWMSHGDTLTKLAPGFRQYGISENGYPALLIHTTNLWFGIQFHPESSHCERGTAVIAAFVFGVCHCEKTWTMEYYIEEARRLIAQQAGEKPVLILCSGGIDSTVTAALFLKTCEADHIHLLYVDTGLMRKNETDTVQDMLKTLGAKHVHILRCADSFFHALKGIEDPETKRCIIGDLFIQIQEQAMQQLGLPSGYILAQGTLYTDLIESGAGVGNKAHLIKSHHNVGSVLVAEKRRAGDLIEPLNRLYKDEVRALGQLLGVHNAILRRHPYPGPGLAIRILGAVSPEKCAILREADAIFIEELETRGLYDKIWQAFAVLLPVRSVGVGGDERTFGLVVALRAVLSVDGMSAQPYPFSSDDICEIATRITNAIPEIGRVVYDISSKPPATIEWE